MYHLHNHLYIYLFGFQKSLQWLGGRGVSEYDSVKYKICRDVEQRSREQEGCQMLLMIQIILHVTEHVAFLVRHSYELKCVGIKMDFDDRELNWHIMVSPYSTKPSLILHSNYVKAIYIKFAVYLLLRSAWVVTYSQHSPCGRYLLHPGGHGNCLIVLPTTVTPPRQSYGL